MGFKNYNYLIWKEIFYLVEEKVHLTLTGILKIQHLKDLLNKWS